MEGLSACRCLASACPSRFEANYLPPFFPHTKPGWGGAGEDTGSEKRGLTKVMRLVMGPRWSGGGVKDDLLAGLLFYSAGSAEL